VFNLSKHNLNKMISHHSSQNKTAFSPRAQEGLISLDFEVDAMLMAGLQRRLAPFGSL
jgi:hypothetical protein